MAKKTTSSISAIIFIALIILFIALIILGIYSIPKEPVSESIIGSSVLSLDEVDLISSSQFFNEKTWVYTLVADGLGQSATGDFTPKEVGDEYSGSEQPIHDFLINTEFNQECVYPIVKDNFEDNVRTLTYKEFGFGIICSEDDAIDECGSSTIKYGDIGFKCFCISETLKTSAIGNVENFYNPEIDSEMDITVEVKDNVEDSETLTLQSDGKVKGYVGDNVYAIWLGNLETGDACDLPSTTVVPAYVTGNWKLYSNSKYDTWVGTWENFENDILECTSNCPSEEEIEAQVNNVNSKANDFTNTVVTFGNFENKADINNAKVRLEVISLIQKPLLTMYVKASWIGIITPTPVPKITDISSSCFGSGEKGFISTTIENTGETGTIDVFGQCDAGFDVESEAITINANQEKTISLELTGSTDEEKLNGKCTITAQGLEISDTETIDVCVEGIKFCTAGNQWCDQNQVIECDNDEIHTSIKDICSSTEICQIEGNDASCVKKDGGGGNSSFFSDLFDSISDFINEFVFVIAVIFALISNVLSTLFTYDILKKNRKKTKDKTTNIIISAIIGLAIGILVYYLVTVLWWLGLIALVLFIIIKTYTRK